jgi:hypothetical protein
MTFKLIVSSERANFLKLTYYTHIRAVAWIAGMVLGYFTFFQKNQRIKINKFLNAALWILSISLIFTTIVGRIPIHIQRNNTTSREMIAFYHSSSKIGFIFALSWIIFACQQLKTGGIIKWFLSFPHWQPLGRMGLR